MTQADTVKDFCKSHSISESFFYKLRTQGKAPNIIKVGNKTLITSESAEHWRKSMVCD